MENYNNRDYEDYKKACRIANRIGDIMQSKEGDDQELKELFEDEASTEITERLSNKLVELCEDFDRQERHQQSKQLATILKSKRSKVSKSRLTKILTSTVAAAIVIASFLVWNKEEIEIPTRKVSVITTGKIYSSPVKPTLILSNGENVDISATNKIDLKVTDLIKKEDKKDTVEYNTVIIPKQFTFNVTLSDGTIVHLNATSELKYPTKFIGEKREIFLKGEAFFEVKKGAKPFIVTTSGMSVKVYGTKFNVNAHNKNNIQTVLVEGSVSVKYGDDSTETFIKPNQMVTLNSSGEVAVANVNANYYTAWMSGFIHSNEESLANLLDNIAKWYGVEFLYTEDIKTIKVSASLSREIPIEKIINAIEEISGVRIVKKEEAKYMVL